MVLNCLKLSNIVLNIPKWSPGLKWSHMIPIGPKRANNGPKWSRWSIVWNDAQWSHGPKWSIWSQMVPKGLKWLEMVRNGPKWSESVWNDPEWSYGSKWSHMIPNGPKRSEIVQNGPKWSKMVLNGPKWSKWYEIVSKCPKRFCSVLDGSNWP